MRLKTLLGDYPVTRACKDGRVRSELVELDFADVIDYVYRGKLIPKRCTADE